MNEINDIDDEILALQGTLMHALQVTQTGGRENQPLSNNGDENTLDITNTGGMIGGEENNYNSQAYLSSNNGCGLINPISLANISSI
jgi:hypothetical protein